MRLIMKNPSSKELRALKEHKYLKRLMVLVGADDLEVSRDILKYETTFKLTYNGKFRVKVVVSDKEIIKVAEIDELVRELIVPKILEKCGGDPYRPIR